MGGYLIKSMGHWFCIMVRNHWRIKQCICQTPQIKRNQSLMSTLYRYNGKWNKIRWGTVWFIDNFGDLNLFVPLDYDSTLECYIFYWFLTMKFTLIKNMTRPLDDSLTQRKKKTWWMFFHGHFALTSLTPFCMCNETYNLHTFTSFSNLHPEINSWENLRNLCETRGTLLQ